MSDTQSLLQHISFIITNDNKSEAVEAQSNEDELCVQSDCRLCPVAHLLKCISYSITLSLF